MFIILKTVIMFGLIAYLTLVALGTGAQIHDAVKERKNRKSANTPTIKPEYRKSEYSDSSDSSDYTPILDSPDFYSTFGGY